LAPLTDLLGMEGYREAALVGAGGFSTVYRAFQERFGRQVAVKVLSTPLADEASRRRFLRECRIAGSFSSHPNIVTVLDAGFTDRGQAYIVFEYMPGGSLARRLEERGNLSLKEALTIGVKLSGALATIHQDGVLHRDVKPLNVLFSGYGEPCLTDFGISAIVTAGATQMTNSLTPLYSAPEILDGETSTHAADIYSLGATLYDCLAGRAPFEPERGEGMRATLERIFTTPPPPVGRDDLPPRMEAILRRCLESSPAGRYGAADELGRALQSLQATLGFDVVPMIVPPTAHVGEATATEPRASPVPPVDTGPLPPNAAPPAASPTRPPEPDPVATLVRHGPAAAPPAASPTRPPEPDPVATLVRHGPAPPPEEAMSELRERYEECDPELWIVLGELSEAEMVAALPALREFGSLVPEDFGPLMAWAAIEPEPGVLVAGEGGLAWCPNSAPEEALLWGRTLLAGYDFEDGGLALDVDAGGGELLRISFRLVEDELDILGSILALMMTHRSRRKLRRAFEEWVNSPADERPD
jgi:serine/threonine protein kinase